MQILLTSEYDSEVLLEDDISPTAIHQELTDRILEIEVSINEVAEWLDTEQSTLKVSEAFGETISIVKQDFDILPQVFVECDSIYDANDLFNQVVDGISEMPEIDMDIGDYLYDDFDANSNAYEKLRRWVESHPIQWHKLTLAEIADASKVNTAFVHANLATCVISAKYVNTEDEYKQKRKQSRKGMRKSGAKRSQSLAKLQEWLRQNYNRWQSVTFEEISDESDISIGAVYNNLGKLLLAEGFISNMSEYQRKRKACRGYKGRLNAPMQLIDVI